MLTEVVPGCEGARAIDARPGVGVSVEANGGDGRAVDGTRAWCWVAGRVEVRPVLIGVVDGRSRRREDGFSFFFIVVVADWLGA